MDANGSTPSHMFQIARLMNDQNQKKIDVPIDPIAPLQDLGAKLPRVIISLESPMVKASLALVVAGQGLIWSEYALKLQ